MQFFPWMEVVVRYTEGRNRDYLPGSVQTWKDKGLDVKFRLLQEGEFFPGLALGMTDLGGTGEFSGEYIVASKRFKNIDLSLGLGWGRLGGIDHIGTPGLISNILSNVDQSFGDNVSFGGDLRLGNFFTDKSVSIFGGIEYFTPIPNFSVKLEYDTSDYGWVEGNRLTFHDNNPNSDLFKLDTRLNIAMNYRYEMTERDKVDLSLGFVHGNTLYANVAVHSNLNFSGKPNITMGAEKVNQPYLEPYPKLNADWKKYLSDSIMWQMGNAGIATHRLIFNGNELLAEISQSRFQKTIHAIDLAARFLANNSPTNIDKITVINIDEGIETLRATVSREALVNSVANGALDETLLEFNIFNPLDPGAIVKDNDYLYPHLSTSLRPNMRGTLQHQARFYFWQLEVLASAVVSFTKGLYLTAEYGIDIANNFEDYYYHIPDGTLYHVRQNRRLYLTQGESGLRSLALDYFIDLHPNVKAKLSVGYLEWMYGGYGGEILYMPDHKQWALGLDAHWVKQREYDGGLNFLDYETVTGFLSFYYDVPFYDMRFKINAGKFLGKDTGVHVDISRRFNTGARVGAIVAITNCNPSCVGEGSFNKWIYFELPMNLYARKSATRGTTGFSWAPLTKDAGQRVERGNLYNLVVDAKDEVDSLRRKPWSAKKILSAFGTSPKKKI